MRKATTSRCWLYLDIAVLLLTVGLWNASVVNSEKGFYAMAFLLSLVGPVTIQKTIRDAAQFKTVTEADDDLPTVR